MEVFRALFGRRWWWVTLIVLILMVILARLGIWQLDRLDQRRDQNAALTAALAEPALNLGLTAMPQDLELLKDRQVTATGRFDLDQQIVLKVQKWQGQPGAHLITPLVLRDGKTAVLVDRGWIPEADNNEDGREKYDPPESLTVEGYAALSQTLSRASDYGQGEPQVEWYRVDIANIQPQMPYDLLPIYVLQAPEQNAVPPFRLQPEPDLSEGPHLGYAIQWFIFSAGLGIAYVLFVRKSLQEPAAS